jgi:hypothetical protein
LKPEKNLSWKEFRFPKFGRSQEFGKGLYLQPGFRHSQKTRNNAATKW